MEDPQTESQPGPTPAQIDPAEIARLEALPSGQIDIPKLLAHMEAARTKDTDPFAVGQMVLDTDGKPEGGFEVRIIDADGYRRQVTGKMGGSTDHTYWVYVSQLKPLPVEEKPKIPFDVGEYALCSKKQGKVGQVFRVEGDERLLNFSWGPQSFLGDWLRVNVDTLMPAPSPEEAAADMAEYEAEQRPIYPVGSTAVCKKHVAIVDIIKVDGDRRRVQWKLVGEKWTNYDWVSVDDLSQSDDPATVEALAAKELPHFAKGKWAVYKVDGDDTYVKILALDPVDKDRRQITYVNIWETDPVEEWVRIDELKPVLHQEGQMALFLGQVARVETVEEDRRQIVYLKETETWVSDKDLKPLASDDEAGLEIATLEINLAKQRDEAAQQIEALKEQLADQTRQYDTKLKAQLEISQGLQRDLDEVRGKWAQYITDRHDQMRELNEQNEQLRAQIDAMNATDPDPDDISYLENLFMHGMAELKAEIDKLKAQQTQRRKVEIKTLEQRISGSEVDYDDEPGADGKAQRKPRIIMADRELAEFLNADWKTIPELCGVVSSYSNADGLGGSEIIRLVTLQREVQDTAHPPMEVAAVQPSLSDDDGNNHPDHNYDCDQDSEVPMLVHPEPIMSGTPQTGIVPVSKQRPVLPAPTKDPLPHTRQIHRDIEGWKAEMNARVLAAGAAAYQARMDQHGRDDDDDDLLRFTRPHPVSPFSPRSPMMITMQVPS